MPSTLFKGFALVDCNNFYVSCERLFKPHLKKIPSLVLSNNDGCIIARSKEVKALGIPMGAPLFEYRSLIEKHNVHLFSPNFDLYSDMSDRVMSVLYDFSSEMQVYSIDEAFIPITIESEEDFIRLQKKVLKWTGIPVSIGLGPTKTLAKMANYKAKTNPKSFISLMNSKGRDAILETTQVGDIWGVGKKSAEKLKAHGIYNALQLKKAPKEWVKSKLHLPGLRTLLELEGTPCYCSQVKADPQKSLTYSSTFGSPITSFERLRESVVHYTSKAASKLRSKSRLTQMMSLYLKSRNGSFQRSLSLDFPTNSTPTLIEGALKLLSQMYQNQTYKKAGINFWELSGEKEVQLDFRSTDKPVHTQLMKTLDQINSKYGSNTLFYAGEGTSKPWLSKRELLSNQYTTKLSEILKINI